MLISMFFVVVGGNVIQYVCDNKLIERLMIIHQIIILDSKSFFYCLILCVLLLYQCQIDERLVIFLTQKSSLLNDTDDSEINFKHF